MKYALFELDVAAILIEAIQSETEGMSRVNKSTGVDLIIAEHLEDVYGTHHNPQNNNTDLETLGNSIIKTFKRNLSCQHLFRGTFKK